MFRSLLNSCHPRHSWLCFSSISYLVFFLLLFYFWPAYTQPLLKYRDFLSFLPCLYFTFLNTAPMKITFNLIQYHRLMTSELPFIWIIFISSIRSLLRIPALPHTIAQGWYATQTVQCNTEHTYSFLWKKLKQNLTQFIIMTLLFQIRSLPIY